jgi:hypothetical protein
MPKIFLKGPCHASELHKISLIVIYSHPKKKQTDLCI